VDFWLDRSEKGLHLCVADDGVGIADVVHARGLSHGLEGIAHRVRSMTGTFDVVSTPGGGTRVEIFVPLKK
jgi:signal transduction histidine kinase